MIFLIKLKKLIFNFLVKYLIVYIKKMFIRTRYLVPTFTWASNYIHLINSKTIKLIEPLESSNKILAQHFRFDFANNDSGHIEIEEKINQTNPNLQEESIKLHLVVKKDNSIIEENIGVVKSPWYYQIGYKMHINGIKVNSQVLTNSNYNSKNFEHNFKYYLNKYNYKNKSDI